MAINDEETKIDLTDWPKHRLYIYTGAWYHYKNTMLISPWALHIYICGPNKTLKNTSFKKDKRKAILSNFYIVKPRDSFLQPQPFFGSNAWSKERERERESSKFFQFRALFRSWRYVAIEFNSYYFKTWSFLLLCLHGK